MVALLQAKRGFENPLAGVWVPQGTVAGPAGLEDNEPVLDRRQFVARLCAALAAATCKCLVAQTKTAAPPPEERVDLNHASIDQLMKVPGMTRSWAGRIVRFRPYRAKTDLVDHGVVPIQFYEKIKDYVIAHRDAQ